MGRLGWTTAVWRFLCLLALISALVVITGCVVTLPRLVQGLVLLPLLLVMLLAVVAWFADSSTGSKE